MTFDIVGLCRERPYPALILAAMRQVGGGLRVDAIEEAQLLQLYHPDGRLLLTIEGARLIQVAGEVQRLLGIAEGVPHPVWWVESRAPGVDRDAEAVARQFTHALVAATGGMSWSSR